MKGSVVAACVDLVIAGSWTDSGTEGVKTALERSGAEPSAGVDVVIGADMCAGGDVRVDAVVISITGMTDCPSAQNDQSIN